MSKDSVAQRPWPFPSRIEAGGAPPDGLQLSRVNDPKSWEAGPQAAATGTGPLDYTPTAFHDPHLAQIDRLRSLLERARVIAEWHDYDRDECGELARALMADIDKELGR